MTWGNVGIHQHVMGYGYVFGTHLDTIKHKRNARYDATAGAHARDAHPRHVEHVLRDLFQLMGWIFFFGLI